MAQENGNISINTENIFPIIKKWLYSEKDIFLRELVSNASDALSKLAKLSAIGEAEVGSEEKYTIHVSVNKEEKTIAITDNGIGMTEEEVRKYINQIAFSGAKDFLEKYKDKTDDAQIIGHFGLGFYSAFMVAEKVRIDTLSYIKGSTAVKWTSTGGTEFQMDLSDKKERGTTVTLYMAADSLEFLDEFKTRETLEKYFSFLPYEIYIENASAEKKDEEKENKPLNDTKPLWIKNPRDCTDEEYKEFYRKVFHDFNEPLFWIHLNMDYPFNLKGILYFPKLKHEFETMEGQIKLYYNQVFVADNIKEVIPEFLMLLKGTLDCPDLPLNVSRSFLQNDGYVSKISSHITKKVGDKLTQLFESERENYNKYWDDINPFVKYGCIREAKFFERVKDIITYKTTGGEYVTLKDYLERNKDKHKDKVFYVSDEKQQAQYIKMFKDHGMEAVILSTMIDNHFVQFLETHESGAKFQRIDSDLSESMKNSEGESSGGIGKSEAEGLEKLFKEVLGKEKLKVQVENLKATSVPSLILLSEQSRRFAEMSKMFGGGNMGPMFEEEQTLVLNGSNALIKGLLRLKDTTGREDDVKLVCEHIFDLAMLSHKKFEPEDMTRFIDRSNKILEKITT